MIAATSLSRLAWCAKRLVRERTTEGASAAVREETSCDSGYWRDRGASRKVFKRFLALLGERVGKSGRAVLAPVVGLELLGATVCQAIEDVGCFWRERWRLSLSGGTAQRKMLLSAYDGLRRNGNKPLRHQRPQRPAGNAGKDEGGSTLSGCHAACPDHAGGRRCLVHLFSRFNIKTYRPEEDRIDHSERVAGKRKLLNLTKRLPV